MRDCVIEPIRPPKHILPSVTRKGGFFTIKEAKVFAARYGAKIRKNTDNDLEVYPSDEGVQGKPFVFYISKPQASPLSSSVKGINKPMFSTALAANGFHKRLNIQEVQSLIGRCNATITNIREDQSGNIVFVISPPSPAKKIAIEFSLGKQLPSRKKLNTTPMFAEPNLLSSLSRHGIAPK